MTDLSDFGGGVDEPTDAGLDDEAPGYGHTYRNGRCRALTSDGQRRCNDPTEHDSPTCHMHPVATPSTVLIDDSAIELIEATTRTRWAEFNNERVSRAVERVTYRGGDDE